MDRRQLLKLGGFITASVATLGGLAACGGGGNDGAAPNPSPAPGTPPATGANWKFPQSIASGDPKPDGILLWTRALPASVADTGILSSDTDFTIRLRVTAGDNAALLGTDKALSGELVVDAAVPVLARFDNTVRHKITGLAPGQTYYYQFVAGDVKSRVGRFKTAPAGDADVAQLKFAFLSCQDWSINHWGAFDALAAENLDFIVHLGDYIYETVGEAFQTGAVETAHAALTLPNGTFKSGTSGAKYASSLADYRYLYKTYRTDPRLQAVHERFAIVATWDDHEFSDDAWGDAETYDNDGTHQPDRRRSASQAWFEFMPADIVFDEADKTDIFNIRIYRELKFGKLAHLVMTDERLYRSDHIIPESALNPATGLPLGSIGARYMVPSATLAAAEAQKIAVATAGPDPLALTSILGGTQRSWWQTTMKNSTATWKLWGNEVSLLRMGVDGTDAIATLVALQAVATLAANISASLATLGDIPTAGAAVAGVTTGAPQLTAIAAAQTIALADAAATDKLAAATGAGLSSIQASVAVSAYDQAKAALPGGPAAQVGAAAQAIAFGFIKPEVLSSKENSLFIPVAQKAGLAPFFQKFVLNADQWDGYNAERKALMKHLVDNGIRNVVALTGDIHAFYAGTVNDNFDAAGGGTPVMVDLVTAGISSDSFFHYLKDAVASLSSSLSTLVYFPLSIPVASLGADPVKVDVNLLDYTLAATVVTPASLAEALRVQLRGALAARGVPEAQLDATTSAVLTGLQSDPAFLQQLVPLCQQLAGLNSNPSLKHANTDAQGYAVVTLTPSTLQCDFRQVNRLVNGKAPAAIAAKQVRATVQKDVAGVTLTQ